jgi:hypothetical protein
MTEEQKISQESRLRPIDILENMRSDLPVFVGFSPRGPVNKPFEIKRWGQFIVTFGNFKKCGFLATAANGFFLNGGKRFLTLNLGERPENIEEVRKRFEEGLGALDDYEDIPFILSPGEVDSSIHELILDFCKKKVTYAVLDGPEELIETVMEEEEAHEEGLGNEKKEETSPLEDTQEIEEETEKYENMPEIKGNNGLLIYPWIYLKDRVMGDFYIPPSGHTAGILCRLYNTNERPAY